MGSKKYGLRISDNDGNMMIEVGSHVVAELPGFAAAIGAVASNWAQAEVNLYCLFAVLMNTTPELAEKEAASYAIAKRATDGARRIAAEHLTGSELQGVNEALDSLDAVRPLRNRVQHDTWGRKSMDSGRLYRIHRNQYLAITLKMLDVQKMIGTTAETGAIKSAWDFVEEISEGYTISELERIAEDIDAASKLLLEAMFVIRARQLRASSQFWSCGT
ncbi:hypothetical protein JY423_05705 [Stenotrophomonas maltophilia]|nr:hypothetical protein [Stenotrophomonas maltophilia]MBN4961751.1 hypothetical protein [Stenotrophomonas maltophilia]